MKSNQLNAIALLLLATAGISAVDKYTVVQKALDIVRSGEAARFTEEEGTLLPDSKITNFAARMVSARTAKDKTFCKNAILAIANENATFVQRNKARGLRAIDYVVKHKSPILKTIAAVAAVTATAYAVDHYANEGKGLAYTKNAGLAALINTRAFGSSVYATAQEYGSWLYSKCPAKPTWLAMPAIFGGKKTEAKLEDKQPDIVPSAEIEATKDLVNTAVETTEEIAKETLAKKDAQMTQKFNFSEDEQSNYFN